MEVELPEAEGSLGGDSLQSIEDEMLLFEAEHIPKKTQDMNKWGMNTFKKWAVKSNLEQKTIEDLKTLPPTELNSVLRKFYYQVRTVDGKLLKPISLRGIRAAMYRNLKSEPNPYKFNIMNDPLFESANQMLKTMAKEYITSPQATKTQHKSAISDEDMKKIGLFTQQVMDNPNPEHLMYLVWFHLALYLGERAREKWTDYLLGDLEFEEDARGKYIVLCKTRLMKSKTLQGGISDSSLDNSVSVRIYQDESIQYDAYNIVKFYIDKMGTTDKSIRLFIKPNAKYNNPDQPWYHAKCPIGRNTISKIMTEISNAAKLSTRYTNHCVRASTVTHLRRNGASRDQVRLVTKHKNTDIIQDYEDEIYATEVVPHMHRILASTLQPVETSLPSTSHASTQNLASEPGTSMTLEEPVLIQVPSTSTVLQQPIEFEEGGIDWQSICLDAVQLLKKAENQPKPVVYNNCTFNNCTFK